MNPQDIRAAAQGSLLAYGSCNVTAQKGAVGALVWNGNVSIRGTDGGRNWLTDAIVMPWYEYDTFRHLGFLLAAYDLWRPLKRFAKNGDLINGHSMGGGIAINIATMYLMNNMRPRGVITFGAPYSASKGAFEYLESHKVPVVAYEQHDDPVPRIPALLGATVFSKPKERVMLGEDDWGLDASDHKMAAYKEAVEATLSPQLSL